MVYVFLAHGFEEVEALTPVDMMRRAGIEVVTVGVGGKEITGAHGITVCADITTDMVDASKADMVVLPGGMPGTLNLQADTVVQTAIDTAVQNDKYVAAICAAPLILGHKNLLNGKKATCYTGFEKDLLGATATGEPVCVDGRFITARGAGVALEFSWALITALKDADAAQAIRAAILCS